MAMRGPLQGWMLPTPELEIACNLPGEGCSAQEAERYTRWLATHHYENFTVVSWLLPRNLRQHFYNVYAYCRWSDDLSDEVFDPARSLVLLAAWEQELRRIEENGAPTHPVLIALRGTIRAKEIPLRPFTDLLKAFRQDQVVTRYGTWEDVFDYCAHSANPVGRLVLYLCGYRDEERQRLSDCTCTALQLANFWQDVSRDIEKGRIYIPIEALAKYGLTEDDVLARRFDERYIALMRFLLARTRRLFDEGRALAGRVERTLSIDIELFGRGGIAILDAIEDSGYNTLERRPALTKWSKLRLFGQAFGSRAFQSSNGGSAYRDPRSHENKPRPSPPGNPPRSAELNVTESYAECNRLARASRSSFYWAFFGLRKEKRNALCALYAFMRLVDDVSDEPGDLESKRSGLARWRGMLDEAIAGRTQAHAVLPALADTISRFEIPTRYFHDLILGAEMDLTVASYATFDRLSEYCYRVAGTVGLTCLHVFGFTDPRAPDMAERLGLAFQLTNIIRDVPADLKMGRVYLPLEDLSRFGVPESDLCGPLTPALRDLLLFSTERAWRFYDEGAPLVSEVDSDSRATLRALMRTYSTLLARIEEREFDVFSSRVSLSSAEKIKYLLMSGMAGWWKTDVLAKRPGDWRRIGGPGISRRAG
jgi:squalene synthase HpnC/squalene synthase HpnD